MHAQGCKNVRLVAAGPRFLPHARCVAARSGSALPDTNSDYVRLGATDLEVSRVGVGTLAWGDPKQGFGNRFDEKVVTDIFNLAVELGLNFFDSAEVYGYQGIKEDTSSECLVRRCDPDVHLGACRLSMCIMCSDTYSGPSSRASRASTPSRDVACPLQ